MALHHGYLMAGLLTLLFADQCIDLSQATSQTTNSPPATTTAPGHQPSCLEDWLVLAGATSHAAHHLARSMQVKQAGLDEHKVKEFSTFVIGILLGFDKNLARELKSCIMGNTTCPADSEVTHFPCQDTGHCVYSSRLGRTQCECASGLVGDRCQTDVNECESPELNGCGPDQVAECFNTHGSYACGCRPGYFGNGVLCKDIDECQERKERCSEQAYCNNTIGSYTCTCKPGYEGDGFVCEVDLCATSKDSGVCRRMERLETHIQQLESKLKIRDRQINTFMDELKLMSSVFTHQHRSLKATDKRLTQLEQRNETCGMVNWQTFTQTNPTKAANMIVWNAKFNKTWTDTTLRVTYSTMLGLQASNAWSCFTFSILINGEECSDPAPIQNTFNLHAAYSSNVHQFSPTVITGTCRNIPAGTISLTTRTVKACSRQMVHESKYQGPTTPPASMFVEELSKC
ncbi:uncharacterized protein LOC135824770 isoform X2 [Sycon ciliatum]|uniref:uncharacterized protein LOC135824770 isoform X2 n=1 Tax=Sycon ciliatum TaxID=27933 RepID=UPI0031F6F34C